MSKYWSLSETVKTVQHNFFYKDNAGQFVVVVVVSFIHKKELGFAQSYLQIFFLEKAINRLFRPLF